MCSAALLAIAPAAALAQDIAPVGDPLEVALIQGPLLPGEVLRSSALTFPSILEAFEREAATRSDQLAADGAFDLMLRAEAFDRITGFNDGGAVRAEAVQPLRPFGAQLFGGYTLSSGPLPTSQSSFNSPEFGRFNVGALFSLLRDRDIDPRRFAIEDTRLAASQARLDVMLVATERPAGGLARLLALGRGRRGNPRVRGTARNRRSAQSGLAREVREGARPRIALVENEQNLLRRRTLLEQAKRDFETASNSLGFYLRGRAGN